MCTKEQPEDNKLICITIKALSTEDLTTAFKLTVFTRMDAAATIIFVPGKMRHLSEGGYYSRVASIRGMCMHVLLPIYDTVDNNITLTFRFVSVPFFWNDSTVLRSVFRPFYGPSFDRSAVRLSAVLRSVFRAFYGNEQRQLYDVQVRRNGTF